MARKYVLTKIKTGPKLFLRSYYFTHEQEQLLIAGAGTLNLTRSDFLRDAIRQRSETVLAEHGLTIKEALSRLGAKQRRPSKAATAA